MFNTLTRTYLGAAIAASACIGTASAAITFDANVTPDVIFGTGNANGGFAVHQSNGVELGLRAKPRFPEANVFPTDAFGTYSFATGGPNATTALWSFEWSINSDYGATSNATALNAYTYKLRLDSDPSQATSFLDFDPINDGSYWDHAIGTNSTGNSSGVKAADSTAYGNLIGSNNVAQNSWQPHWFMPIDSTIDGTYDFELLAFDGNGAEVAATRMTVQVGQGGASVPDGGSMIAMLGGSLLGLAGFRRFLRKG